MAVLQQYTYIFAVTTIFACLDAWNIGVSWPHRWIPARSSSMTTSSNG